MSLSLTDAFLKYKAKLVNVQWAVSAISENNELVISCWFDRFVPRSNPLRYEDKLTRWAGNIPGNNLCKKDLQKAFSEELDVRVVIAKTIYDKNIFNVREDLIGKVTLFDGDKFFIEFKKKS